MEQDVRAQSDFNEEWLTESAWICETFVLREGLISYGGLQMRVPDCKRYSTGSMSDLSIYQ
jgi:hypothetical protein